MLRRRLNLYEQADFAHLCDLSLAFEFANRSAVSQALDNLDRSVLPLHLRHENGDLISVPSPAPRYPLPTQIHDLTTATNWVHNHHPINYNQRLANLAFNDSKVVLNMSHGFSDGGYLKFLTEHLFDSNPVSLPSLPPRIEDLLSSEFAVAPTESFYWTYDPELIRFSTRHSNLGNGSEFIQFKTLRFRAPELPSFNQKVGKLKDTTDCIWMALLLSSAVVGGSLPEWAAFCNCADLRRRLQKPDLSILKFYGHLNARTKLGRELTLREVGRRLREDMMQRFDGFEEIGRIKYGEKRPQRSPFPGVILEVSNVGPIRIKWPIVDVWAGLRVRSELPGDSLSIMAYSIVGEKKNDLVLILRYSDAKVGEDEIVEIAKLVEYMMKKMSLDRTVQSAFDELKEFNRGKID
jgi:hypothetical protein